MRAQVSSDVTGRVQRRFGAAMLHVQKPSWFRRHSSVQMWTVHSGSRPASRSLHARARAHGDCLMPTDPESSLSQSEKSPLPWSALDSSIGIGHESAHCQHLNRAVGGVQDAPAGGHAHGMH